MNDSLAFPRRVLCKRLSPLILPGTAERNISALELIQAAKL